MSTISVIEYIPGEQYFIDALQSNLTFVLGKKQVKTGRLILFKRAHFHIVFTILNGRNNKENFEIPIPFKIEHYPDENIMYFDYRIHSLAGNNKDIEDRLNAVKIRGNIPTQYYNKILEITSI
jgi:hypothetical protein